MSKSWNRVGPTTWARDYWTVLPVGPARFGAIMTGGADFGTTWSTPEEAMWTIDKFEADNAAFLKAAGAPGSEQFAEPIKDFYGK